MNFEDIDRISVDISQDSDKIVCSVEVPAYSSHFPTKIVLRTPDIKKLLEREGHCFANVAKEADIDNRYVNTLKEGTWVFSKEPPRVPKKRANKTSAPKTPKTQKSIKK